jgi:hypothetical protein
MKKSQIILVFIFLLTIPYLCSLAIIGIGYNALVYHASSVWRSLVGALIGSLIMVAIKATIQRPLDLLAMNTADRLLGQFLRFFSIRRRPFFQLANLILDFVLCLLATVLVRKFLTLNQIVGSATGLVLLVMFISTCLGAYIEYDNLSIYSQHS